VASAVDQFNNGACNGGFFGRLLGLGSR